MRCRFDQGNHAAHSGFWLLPAGRPRRRGDRMKRRKLLIVLGGGAMAAWPFGAAAQQKLIPGIGVLSIMPPGSAVPFVAAFRQGWSKTGYVESQNVTIESRWAEVLYDQLPALSA